MNFHASVHASALKNAVTILRKLRVPKEGIGSHLVRLRLTGGRLHVITSDGDIQIDVPIFLAGPACGEEVIISRAALFQVSKEADRDQPVRFDSVEEKLPNGGIYRGVEIQYVSQGFAATHATPRSADKDAWPLSAVAGPRFPLDTSTLAALRLARAFTSTDDTRYVLNGACLDPVHGGRLISTDGRRMLIAPARPVGRRLIVPNAVLDILTHKDLHSGALLTLLPPDDDRVKDRASIRFGSTATLTFTCITGNYPNWQQVIPSAGARTGSIAFTPATTKRLVTWLRAKKEQTLLVEPREGAVRLTRHPTAAKDQDQRDIATVPAGIIDNPPSKVAFSASFFADALAAGLHTLDLIDAMSPGVFTNGTSRVVLMPMRTTVPVPEPAKENEEEPATA